MKARDLDKKFDEGEDITEFLDLKHARRMGGDFNMSTVHEIQTAVSKLSAEELSTFHAWFVEFDAEAWDRQFEKDVAEGRLDALAEEALRDLSEGRCKDL